MTQTQGRYVVVDTTLSITDSTPIPGLNGRQGDNGRIVYFALKDGRLPHNLDGQDVTLQVKDAAGKVKIVNGIYDMISATAGLFSMLIPAEVYQAAGDVEEAFLVVTDQQHLVISSIPITFTVFANGIILSANASKDFISGVKEAIDQANELVKGLNDSIEVQNIAYKTLQESLNKMINAINSNQVAVKTAKNVYSEQNVFNDNVDFNGPTKFDIPIDGRFKSAVLANGTDLFTLIEPGYHYIVGKKEYADTIKNKPDGLVNAFSVDTIDVAGYLPNSWATTLLKITEAITGKVYSCIISRDNKGVISQTSKWRTEGDGTVFSKTLTINGIPVLLKRIGNLVSLSFHIYGALKNTVYTPEYSVWAASGTIPPGYRPTSLILIPADRSAGKKSDGTALPVKSGYMATDIDGSIITRQFDMALPNDDGSLWIEASTTYITLDSYPN